MILDKIQSGGFEQVVFLHDKKVGLKAIVSLHSTRLGPGVGGVRMWDYKTEEEAIQDALNLSKGMTYKAAISGLNWGGGKAVIIGNPKKDKTPAMLARFGEFVQGLSGRYVTAKDVGIGADDLRAIKTKTQHILGIDGEPGSSGDPSPCTAFGVYHGIKACLGFQRGSDSLSGVTVALQGLGSVSYYLLDHFNREGAKVVACDIDEGAIARAKAKTPGIKIVSPEAIFDEACDVFSPSALGGAINSKTRPRIKSKIIAGAANNQLATPEDGQALFNAGVLYAPDYAINAGGLINIYHEHDAGGYKHDAAFKHAEGIGQTVRKILARSKEERLPTHVVADRMAEERFLK